MSATPAPARALSQPREEILAGFIQRVAAGEQSGLADLYDHASPLVYGLALRMLRDAADAEEITLDVFNQVWRSASSFDLTRGRATTWLVMLTRSRAIDRIRSASDRRKREQAIQEYRDLPADAAAPDESSSLNEQRRLVLAALQQLGREQSEVIELAFFSGLTHSELAEKLGLPLGTVKTRIRLGMMKLRELLGPLGGMA